MLQFPVSLTSSPVPPTVTVAMTTTRTEILQLVKSLQLRTGCFILPNVALPNNASGKKQRINTETQTKY